MTASADGSLAWQDLVLDEAEVISLRLRGSIRSGLQADIRYNVGTITVTITDPLTQHVSTRVLDEDESTALLAALRKQSRVTPRIKLVNAAALHSFISSLAVSLYSSGAVPFGTAAFGAVTRTGDGDLVGELAFGAESRATVTDANGALSYQLDTADPAPGSARRLSLTQLRMFISALRIYLTSQAAGANPLWQRILADAVTSASAQGGTGQ